MHHTEIRGRTPRNPSVEPMPRKALPVVRVAVKITHTAIPGTILAYFTVHQQQRTRAASLSGESPCDMKSPPPPTVLTHVEGAVRFYRPALCICNSDLPPPPPPLAAKPVTPPMLLRVLKVRVWVSLPPCTPYE